MERSAKGTSSRGVTTSRRVEPWLRALLMALETLARLSVPAGILLLSRGSTALAAAASTLAVAATLARGFVASFAVERALRATFSDVVNAALRLALVDLRAERKMGLLAEAAREVAAHEATMIPLIGAHAIGIALTWASLAAVIGPLWSAALLVVAAPLLAALALGARRIRAEQQTAWDVFTELAIDLRVLVEACVELRAHGRELSFSQSLETRARSFAAAERRASVWSATSAAVPALLVLLSAATPVGHHIARIVGDATGRRAAEIAIPAAAALYFALGLGKLLEHRARVAPFRDTLSAFLATAENGGLASFSSSAAPPSQSPPDLPDLRGATITFRAVSCRHRHAARATPANVEHAWSPGRGLVLSGENGAGKTTLVLALLGLFEPIDGALEIDGAPLDPALFRALRERTAYLAQSPFFEPGATVEWHLRLFARAPIDDARIDEALRRVGLFRILEEHAARATSAQPEPRKVPVGELSGGERQRMHIARALVQDAELIVLDEPEAGLDRETRAEMARLFEGLAEERRVLVIAHDPTVVPASFERLEIRAEPRPRSA